MSPLTLAELRSKQAELTLRAELLRSKGRTVSAVGPEALDIARAVRETQGRADDYRDLIRVAEGATP